MVVRSLRRPPPKPGCARRGGVSGPVVLEAPWRVRGRSGPLLRRCSRPHRAEGARAGSRGRAGRRRIRTPWAGCRPELLRPAPRGARSSPARRPRRGCRASWGILPCGPPRPPGSGRGRGLCRHRREPATGATPALAIVGRPTTGTPTVQRPVAGGCSTPARAASRSATGGATPGPARRRSTASAGSRPIAAPPRPLRRPPRRPARIRSRAGRPPPATARRLLRTSRAVAARLGAGDDWAGSPSPSRPRPPRPGQRRTTGPDSCPTCARPARRWACPPARRPAGPFGPAGAGRQGACRSR